MKINRILGTASALVLCATAGGAASAQLSTATMFGVVRDASGAAIPNASITLTQTETNFSSKITAKEDGSYHVEFLPVGPYKITVSSAGFKTLERSGVVLSVMQNAEVNLALEIGGAADTVNVSSDVPLINIGNSTLGNTVDNVEIDNLPLINRDVTRLLQLVPGVQSVQTSNSLGFQELHVLVNGAADSLVGQTSYYLDGGLNMTGLRNSGNAVPNPDAVSQFNVVTNNYSAQLGKYSSAVVSVITKSGTNKFHGSAFEFYRSRNFNATTHLQGSKNPYNQHRFGGTVGGPIRHDKDFFFASAAAFRFIQYGNYSGSLPSLAQQAGNFSENTPTAAEQANCKATPTAAANTAVHFLVCNPATGLPYANNTLPTVDPTAVNILKYIRANLPTQQPAQFGDTQYTYRTRSPLPEQNNEYLIKTDHQIAAKHRLTLSYFMLDYKVRSVPSTFTQAWSYSDYANKQQNANVGETWTVSDRTVNQFFVGYTRQNGGRNPVPGNSTLADFGSDFGVVGTPSRGQIAVGGVEAFTLGQAITGPKAGSNVYNVRDVLATTRGKHSLYVGGEAGLEKDFQLTSLSNYGVFTFSTTNGASGARTTNGLSDFLAGVPATMAQDTGLYANASYFNYGVFAQDDWRILSNLTLNLGLRYDWQQAPTEPLSRQTNFVPGAQSHAFPNVNIVGKTGPQLAPVGLQFPGDPGVPRGGVFTPKNHFSPRFGFAYDPGGRGTTVFHGAAGLFFGGISGNEWEFPSNFAPYAVRNTYNKVVSLTHPYQGDPTEFPTGTNPYPALSYKGDGNVTFLPLNQVVAFDPNYKWPYSIQINAGFQHQLTKGLAISAYYVGSLNRKLPLYNDINGPQFNITAAGTSGASCTDLTKACGYANNSNTVNNRRPLNSQFGASAANPLYSQVYIIRSNQNSNYNGLQVTVEQRLTHRVSARGYYSWSKTLQSNNLNNQGGMNGVFVDNNYPQLEARQRSDQDRRHMMTATIVWKPDYFDNFNHAVRYFANGWTITAIWTANSGQPFTITTGVDNYFSGNGNNRVSVVPGKTPRVLDNNGSRATAMNQWFDTSAFCRPGVDAGCPGVGPLGLLGNFRASTLDSPGYRNIDASIFKDFPLHGEGLKFQIRGESTNVFNLTNLGQPTSVANNTNYGKVTSTSGNNRIIQVGGRILF
ncbi:TonB-dependent receptor [Terriglobus roseus]|uniref:Carboxypeptidase regulatory-like domain-containing protein n=1 Tax=Terriglobus roseus TaxID=392734 RepID=A0A1H4JS86_9BACT|nr:TonB-dependent receptor [Terriglobus roseus]SEB49160.1 Carboxypeptidase regulatory-like domain-containing protein [Terriglobus roseus]